MTAKSVMMKTNALVITLVLLLLAACGGAAAPVATGATDAATAVIGVATPAVAEPVESEPQTARLPPVSAEAPRTGRSIAFTVGGRYEGS